MKRKQLVLLAMLASAFVTSHSQIRQGSIVRKDVIEQVDAWNDSIPEIVVTGTGTEHLLKNAPVQTEVISRKMIESFGGKNVEEILSGLTASFAFNEGDMGSQMQLNGLGNNYILILIDGKRIHGDVGGENDLGMIDPHNIERIEIVKGAQSALYGSDAMAGVINIITRKHDKDGFFVENTTRYGSYNDMRQHNAFGLTMSKFTSQTNFQLQHTDGWQNTGEEYTEGTVVPDSRSKTTNQYTNWQLAERLSYQFSPHTDIYAAGTYYNKEINRPTNGKYASCDVYTYDLMYRNASASMGGKWKINDTDVITLDVDWNRHAYYYQYTATTLTDGYDPQGKLTNYFPYFAGQKNLQSDQQRTMAQLKGIFALPWDNLLSMGTEYRYDYLNAPMRTEGGTADDWTAAFYLQDEFGLLPWFNLTTGLRLTQSNGFGFRATPKLSTLFALGKLRMRLGWSQGFKAPTTKELHYRYLHVMGSSTFFNIGNHNLKAQSSNYYSASLEYRDRKLTASITGYVNRLSNMIALINVPVSEIPEGATSAYSGDGSTEIVARKYKNMESARTSGLDVNLSWNITPEINLGGNYAYLDTHANQYDSHKQKLTAVTIDGMAYHKWNVYITWNHRLLPTYKIGINLSTRGSSTRYYQNNGNGKAFQLWRLNTSHELSQPDARLSYRVEVGVDNIFDFVDRTMRPYHLGSNNPGRTFYASFVMRLKQGKNIKPIINNFNSKSNEDED